MAEVDPRTRVTIATAAVTITVEAPDVTLAEAAGHALALYRDAHEMPPAPGPAYGFSQERQLRTDPTSTMRLPMEVPE